MLHKVDCEYETVSRHVILINIFVLQLICAAVWSLTGTAALLNAQTHANKHLVYAVPMMWS